MFVPRCLSITGKNIRFALCNCYSRELLPLMTISYGIWPAKFHRVSFREDCWSSELEQGYRGHREINFSDIQGYRVE